ncbi:phage resistance protein [Actinomadura craniellae]|uniref:Phage resistance protein n=1 Tax=Actinomadura craniellae TaxID=2231787 RepID=A0A365HA15_9ACTN|nr:phage resistance protein [Actinomadura craniellae]RAY15937.1 phage resistance protein [Actinomadura craniellae]
MTEPLLRDLIEIPERVHAGDFVLSLAKGVHDDSTLRDYVVTDQLAGCFDGALGLIRSAVEGRASQATYLDGSFGSGKSHFMAVLHAILRHQPEAREKTGLIEIVRGHDSWLKGRSFLLVPFHMIGATSLESAVLGGYVDHVHKTAPGKPLPAVYRDEGLLADTRELRATLGDESFIAGLPESDDEWGEPAWDSRSLDAALAAPPGDAERRRLVTDLTASYFKRYARAVGGTDSFIELDKGLAEISRHAKDVMGVDAIVLLLDELVLWLASYISDTQRVKAEALKIAKLVESAEHHRPAPIISFVPRQRDLRDLVGRDVTGAETTSLFDTLKYGDGRFNIIRLEDRNLPAIVKNRLLRLNPDRPDARAVLEEAFERTRHSRSEVRETLLDAQGGPADWESFRDTYPFSPAFLHTMVDVSGALQRQRTALKLMQQLLVDYRDTLPVGRLIPLGAIYDVLAAGADRPFTDKLRGEFERAKTFYLTGLLPFLLKKHRLAEDQLRSLPGEHAFRGDDLVVKTLLLAALVPNVPALRNLTAGRLAALNHGSIVTMLPGQDRAMVAKTLRDLAAEFGEIRVSGADDPLVEVALIGVDTQGVLRDVNHVDDGASRRRLVKSLLWAEFGVHERGETVTDRPFVWRGTERVAELVFGNVRDPDLADHQFEPQITGNLRVVVDYPFDEGTHTPTEDRNRVMELRDRLDRPLTLAWLPSFLSGERLTELGDLVRITYILEQRDRLEQLTPTWTADDRHHARAQFEARRAALTTRLLEALKRAYGVAAADDADLGARSEEPVLALDSRAEGIRPPAGLSLGDALERICCRLLDHAHPKHPDFDPQGRRQPLRRAELVTALKAVELACAHKTGRAEVAKGDIPALKRVLNPLGVGTVGEVLVLRDEWKMLLNRRAAQSGRPTGELRVRELLDWIEEEQPGLPELVAQLLVACYALQDDRAWLRAGKPIPAPELGRITTDMVLRSQELPGEEDFRLAGERASAVFGAGRQPVRTARAVQALAREVGGAAGALLEAAETLVLGLEEHRATLGLDDGTPRLVTARTAADLVNSLAGVADPTRLLNTLAGADLSQPYGIYRASLDSAAELNERFALIRWPILDQLPLRAGENGPQRERARAILDRLREAAARDEHGVALAGVLAEAEHEAIDVVIESANTGAPPLRESAEPAPGATDSRRTYFSGLERRGTGISMVGPDTADAGREENAQEAEESVRMISIAPVEAEEGIPMIDVAPPEVPGSTVRRVRADEVKKVAAELRNDAAAHPDAVYEISWRIIRP